MGILELEEKLAELRKIDGVDDNTSIGSIIFNDYSGDYDTIYLSKLEYDERKQTVIMTIS